MEVQAKFKIIYSDEIIHFLNTLEIKARSKILYNINKCKYIVDKSLFKKLANTDIWEFRTLFNGVQYRLLAFWDTENEVLVITTHGFIKRHKNSSQRN